MVLDWSNAFNNSINENQCIFNRSKQKSNNLTQTKNIFKINKILRAKIKKEMEKKKEKEIKNEFSHLLKKQSTSEIIEIKKREQFNQTTVLKNPPPSKFWNLHHGLNNITVPRHFGSFINPNQDFSKDQNIKKNQNEGQDYMDAFNFNCKSNNNRKESKENVHQNNKSEVGKEKEKEPYHNTKKSYNNFMNFVNQQNLDLNQQNNSSFQQIELNNFENVFIPN
ncbi:hypothetical protein M0813_22245 [Anaeramoeba flamelloides]|uniref:Uncharacterized protein n=1 Tax=Anaeramoeba flamelloides TaxID=1746091 RepID=A0ABQ8YGS5_9EUKA|nr:hypothetical protein M0813_22245 [Anaeramoeba flamelloides]